jgi:hypothetical protein
MSVIRPIIPGLSSSGARVTPLRFSQAPRKWAAREKISLAEMMPTTWSSSITGNCATPSSWPSCRQCSMVSLASMVAGLRTIRSLTLSLVEKKFSSSVFCVRSAKWAARRQLARVMRPRRRPPSTTGRPCRLCSVRMRLASDSSVSPLTTMGLACIQFLTIMAGFS